MIEIKQMQLQLPIKYFPEVEDENCIQVFNFYIFIFLYDKNKYSILFTNLLLYVLLA